MDDWERLPEPLQLQLAEVALREASVNLANYAEALAAEMAAGYMPDRGGEEALRLFASLVRSVNVEDVGAVAGHA